MTIGTIVKVGNATGRIVELRQVGAIVEFESGAFVKGRRLWVMPWQMSRGTEGDENE